MTGDLDRVMANLSGPERARLTDAFAADPELAEGVSTMFDDLPPDIQERLMRRLAVQLEHTPLGGGTVRSALTDVIEDTLRRDG